MTLSISKKVLLVALLPTLIQLCCFVSLLNQFTEEQKRCSELIEQSQLLITLAEYNRLMFRSLFLLGSFLGTGSADTSQSFDKNMAELSSLHNQMTSAVVALNNGTSNAVKPKIANLKNYPNILQQIKTRPHSGDIENDISHKRDKALGSATYLNMYNDVSSISAELKVAESAAEHRLSSVRRQIFNTCILTVLLNIAATVLSIGFFSKLVLERLKVLKKISDELKENLHLFELKKPESSVSAIAWLTTRNSLDEMDVLKRDIVQIAETENTSRRAVRNLVSTSADAIGIFTVDGTMIFANDKLEELVGEEDLSTCIHLDGSKNFCTTLKDISTAGGSCQCEGRFLTPSGASRFHAVLLKSSRAGEVFAIFHDLSKQRNIDQLKLEVMDVVRNALFQPANALSERLERTISTMKSLQIEPGQLVLAENNLKNVAALIGTLHNIESLDLDSVSVNKRRHDLAALVHSSFDVIRPLASEKNIRLEAVMGSLQVAYVDGGMIEKVILNLLSNAIKFGPRHSTITVTSEILDDWLTFTVEDEGPGVTESEVETIFERYNQTELGQSREGSGLGLTICRMLVSAHGGSIQLQSREGEGARFIVRLPVH